MEEILVPSANTASDISSAAAVVVEPERALKPQFDDAVLQVFLLNTFVVLNNPVRHLFCSQSLNQARMP